MAFNGQLVVLDLSAQWSSNSFSGCRVERDCRRANKWSRWKTKLGYLVLDEAWSVLADPHALRWLQGFVEVGARERPSVTCWSCTVGATSPRSVTRGSAHRETRTRTCYESARRPGSFGQPPDEKPERWPSRLGLHRT